MLVYSQNTFIYSYLCAFAYDLNVKGQSYIFVCLHDCFRVQKRYPTTSSLKQCLLLTLNDMVLSYPPFYLNVCRLW